MSKEERLIEYPVSSKTTIFSHTGTIGDVWAAIPAMREQYRKTKNNIILYLVSGQKAVYHDAHYKHPTTNKKGEMVMLNDTVINMMIPLFMAQDWCYECKKWNGEKVNFRLHDIRDTFVNMPNHSLSKWYFYTMPDMTCDLSEKWITVPHKEMPAVKDKLIIGRSERYQSAVISYFFLKKYEDRLLFVGTELEHIIFNARFDLKIPRLIINNFLELAQALQQSVGLLANQTQIFQIAEGLKIPRIVELCREAPNVCVQGKNGYEFYAQGALEYFVDYLFVNHKKPD